MLVQRRRVVGQRHRLRGRLVVAVAQLVVDRLEHQQLRIGRPLAGSPIGQLSRGPVLVADLAVGVLGELEGGPVKNVS